MTHLCPRRLALASLLACSTTACGDDPTGAAAETTSTTSSSTATADTTSAGSTTTTGIATTETTTGTSSQTEGGFIPRPDGGTGGGPIGICVGISQVGHLATVHAAPAASVDPTCDATPSHCGGDIEGVWTIEGHCGIDQLPNFFEDQCPSSSMTVVASDAQGTRTFNGDSTFERDMTIVVDVDLQIDAMECFGIDCAGFGDILDQEPGLDAVCAEQDGECGCLLTITDDAALQGTYEVTTDGVVMTVDGEVIDPVPFCATAERLDVWEPMTNAESHPEVQCGDAEDCFEALGDAADSWVCVEV